MFFEQPEIIKVLKEEYMWSDDDIRTMNYEYTNSVINLIIKESLRYIEQYNLPEIKELNLMLQQYKGSRGEIATEVKLLRFVAVLPAKYPKLTDHLKIEISKLDDSLAKDLTSGLSQEAGMKILKIIEADLNNIDAYQKLFLTQAGK